VKKLKSLQLRVFAAMILIVVLALVFTGLVSSYQYREQSADYHRSRLERKEEQVLKSLENVVSGTYLKLSDENMSRIFNEAVGQISEIQGVDFTLYSIEGDLIKSSRRDVPRQLFRPLLERVMDNERFVVEEVNEGRSVLSSFFFLKNNNVPLAIVHLPYFEDNTFNEYELKEFLERIGIVYALILAVALVVGYFIARYITNPMKEVAHHLAETGLGYAEKIELKTRSTELDSLIESYNRMIDELYDSAQKLARSERDKAWKEMARQVAHEIKNPLTPMQLQVQQFEMSFDPKAKDAKSQLKEFSKAMLQQISTLNRIASAFSDFAQMPELKRDQINGVSVVQGAVQVFTESFIHFESSEAEILLYVDGSQLTQIVNNLVKNAVEACKEVENPEVIIRVHRDEQKFVLSVIDNGAGMSDEVQHRIFEPRFTTKTSGMGLGLAIVRASVEQNQGTIDCQSVLGEGTQFTVSFEALS
jgi:signal transduction histidine kinase